MTLRPEQHKLEDLSRAKFQLVLPRRWVYRDKDKDYGIDGEVELFDNSNKAQGLLFYVQLKATKSENDSKIMNVDLNIETLKYYKKLNIPVLLVRFSEVKDCFYVKWIYNVDLFNCKDKAKSFRIKFEAENLWTTKTSKEIEKRLIDLKKFKTGYFNFPLPCSITIKENKIQEISKAILQTQIKKELHKYSDYIELATKDKSAIEILIDSKELIVNISDLTGCSFHRIDLLAKEYFSEKVSKDILLGVASGMVQIGQIDYCGKIVFENDLQGRLIENTDLLIYLLPPLFQSSYFEKVLELIDGILDSNSCFEVSIVSTINILFSAKTKNKSRAKAIEKFFKDRLITSLRKNDRTQIGIAHYNLGNYYRGRSLFIDSIQNYISAKRFEPRYLNQDYYFSELAGVFFLANKYEVSACLYCKAIELGATGLTKALYADALMFSGKYQNAIDAFLDYLQSTDNVSDQFLLKSLCLEGILDKKDLKSQRRNIDDAIAKADLSKIPKGITAKKQLDQSLDLDLLCGLAWFNYGIIQIEELSYEAAMFSFIMAGLVQNNDIEAWKYATLCSINSKSEPSILGLIIRTAYSYNSEEFLEQLYIHIEHNSGSEEIAKFSEMIELILPENNNKDVPPIVRVMNKEGKFENILK